MTYLVDSDLVIDHLAGRPEALALLQQLTAGGLSVSIITYAEVYEGIYGGRDPKTRERVFRKMLQTMNVLGLSRAVSRRAARIGSSLRTQGTRLPLPDVLIAATAVHYDLTLVTRNLKHYERIPDLKLYREPAPATR
ncbi:MAG TPA: type II toxin-antitoxin system VapC family toxin [Thermomicrobiales bacterium]